MRPSVVLSQKREEIRDAASRYRTRNPRVFGSVVRGTDQAGSDLDILVDPIPGTTLFDLGGLHDELENILGMSVDLVTPADLPAKYREKVLKEAKSI